MPLSCRSSDIGYALKHWIALHRVLGHPSLELDNNASETAIKDFVLARKNFLSIGSDAGGKAMAINLSFVLSCCGSGAWLLPGMQRRRANHRYRCSTD
jgi:hypothetical protein